MISGDKERDLLMKDLPEHVIERIYQDIGQASMCWEHIDRAGVFQTEDACKIAFDLCSFIISGLQGKEEREDVKNDNDWNDR